MMHPDAIMALHWLRQQGKGDKFAQGQASGATIILCRYLEPWEQAYVENVKRQYLIGECA